MSIYSEAARLSGKPTREYVQETLKKLYKTADETDRSDIAAAYRWFMPTPAKVAKTDFEWVAKALSTVDGRRHIQHVHSDGEGTLWATDGDRALWAPTDLPRGFYDAQGNPIEWGYTFPDVARIVPTSFDWCGTVNLADMEVHDDKTGYLKIGERRLRFVRRHLEDVLNGAPLALAMIAPGERQPLFIVQGARRALVMPMKG